MKFDQDSRIRVKMHHKYICPYQSIPSDNLVWILAKRTFSVPKYLNIILYHKICLRQCSIKISLHSHILYLGRNYHNHDGFHLRPLYCTVHTFRNTALTLQIQFIQWKFFLELNNSRALKLSLKTTYNLRGNLDYYMKHQAIFKKLYVCHEGKVTHSMYFHSQSEHSFNLFAIFYHFNLAQFLVEKQILPTSTDRKYKHWGKRVNRQLFKDHGHEIYCWQKDIIMIAEQWLLVEIYIVK